jgi:hypothetical protein
MTVIKLQESQMFRLAHVEVLASRTVTLARSLCLANGNTVIYNELGCSVKYWMEDEP